MRVALLVERQLEHAALPRAGVGPASSNTDRSVRGGRHSVVSCTTFRRVPSTGDAHEQALAEKNSVEIVIRANCLADRSHVTATRTPGAPAATTDRVDRHSVARTCPDREPCAPAATTGRDDRHSVA